MKIITVILLGMMLSYTLMKNNNGSIDGDQLIFIYKANSGPSSQILDFIHKIASPETYECNLCKLTYGNFSMKDSWSVYIDSIDIPVVFHYEDTIENESKDIKEALKPCVFIKQGNETKEILNYKEINKCKNLDQLIQLLDAKLKKDAGTS